MLLSNRVQRLCSPVRLWIEFLLNRIWHNGVSSACVYFRFSLYIIDKSEVLMHRITFWFPQYLLHVGQRAGHFRSKCICPVFPLRVQFVSLQHLAGGVVQNYSGFYIHHRRGRRGDKRVSKQIQCVVRRASNNPDVKMTDVIKGGHTFLFS